MRQFRRATSGTYRWLAAFGLTSMMVFAAGCSATDDQHNENRRLVSPPAASLIVVNGDVRTVDTELPNATAFAVQDGKFVAVGTDEEIRTLASRDTKVIDAEGATVTPGFVDGHAHLSLGLRLVIGIDLYGSADKQFWLNEIAAKASSLPEGEWILGGRWDHSLIGGGFPTKEDIDAVAPNHPVFLNDVDGHSGWVNSKALEVAGITSTTIAPVGGEVMLDPATGEPTGILLETAQNLIRGSQAYIDGTVLSDKQRMAALAKTIETANSVGLTSAHEMADAATFADYETLLADDALTVRIWYGFSRFGDPSSDKAFYERTRTEKLDIVASIEDPAERGPMLVPGYVKYWMDGVLSSHTAVMLEPYSDRPEETGLPTMTREDVSRHVEAANAAGFPVAIHAIGDGAVRTSLDVFNHAGDKPALPNRIEHIEVLHADDLHRFAAENVIASVNPHHAVTTFQNYLTERIGTEREDLAYPYGALHNAGASVVLGSDWPTAPLEPLIQIWAATFRESALGLGDSIWHPENALTFEQALHGYTQAGADAAGWGDKLGSISEGKWADFVILDGTIRNSVQPEIKDMTVRSTYVAGASVYENR